MIANIYLDILILYILPFFVTCSAPRPLPSAVSHYFLRLLQESRNSLKINTYKNRVSKSFRMNTYEKTRGGGGVPSSPVAPEIARSFSLFRNLSQERNINSNVSNRFRTLASLFCRSAQAISFFLNGLRTLYKKHPGVPQLFFIPRRTSAGPEWYSRHALPPSTIHYGLALKTENLQLITPSKQPRLLRPFARNLFQSRIVLPQRLRHFHLLALQRGDQLQRIHHCFPFIVVVRNHINFPRRLFQFLHALRPRLQLFRRVQIVVPLMRRNRFIIRKPGIVPAPMQPHISHR